MGLKLIYRSGGGYICFFFFSLYFLSFPPPWVKCVRLSLLVWEWSVGV